MFFDALVVYPLADDCILHSIQHGHEVSLQLKKYYKCVHMRYLN